MYNNAIIQTNYKPYIPPPKKKVTQEEENKQPEQKGRVITPNDYSGSNEKQKSSADTFAKTAPTLTKINIKQLLIDFNSTLNAIGASEDVESEVKTYLGLVEHQSQKEKPNKKMIVSNLKIAADVLDNYISETLSKPSKVVKDWVDALLLQNIDFKSDANITKGAFESITGELPQTAKLAEKKLAQKAQVQAENVSQNIEQQEVVQTENETDTFMSEVSQKNDKIEELVTQADEFISSAPKKALNLLSDAFSEAQKTNDKAAIAEIYSKIATVHNNINNLPTALDCLHASTTLAYTLGNDELKTQNHKQMGKIYDEAGYMETALGHYFASVAIDGNLDNTESQADTLTNVGKMYTARYVEDEAVDYYKDALELAKVTKNLDIMSNIFKNTAVTFGNAGSADKAMTNYKNAAFLSQKAGNDENLAEIYEQAGDLMLKSQHQKRAADLYKKSYRLAEKLDKSTSLGRLREKLLIANK